MRRARVCVSVCEGVYVCVCASVFVLPFPLFMRRENLLFMCHTYAPQRPRIFDVAPVLPIPFSYTFRTIFPYPRVLYTPSTKKFEFAKRTTKTKVIK